MLMLCVYRKEGWVSSLFNLTLPGHYLIPQRFQIVIIQGHQPHLRIELASVLKPSLRHLQLAQNRVVAREIVVHDDEVGMALDHYSERSQQERRDPDDHAGCTDEHSRNPEYV